MYTAAAVVCILLSYTEFLNRVDDMVVFNRLKREHMAPIVDIQLKEVIIADYIHYMIISDASDYT
jgi:hypothetical protein